MGLHLVRRPTDPAYTVERRTSITYGMTRSDYRTTLLSLLHDEYDHYYAGRV